MDKINLSTYYGGLTIKNPIVIGASNIVTDINSVVKLEEAGAAAIVYKSLFEEQIQMEALKLDQIQESYSDWDAEHTTLFPKRGHAGPTEHMRQLKELRKHISIPLIGSLNCVQRETWLEYALRIEDTGIDGLELNFYANNIDFDKTAQELEDEQVKSLEIVRAGIIGLPLFVKLSPFYTNPLRLIKRMDQIGVDGFILFNRLFQPDIDIEIEDHNYPFIFSGENDNRLSLRYAGLLYKQVKGEVICNTGIMNGRDVIKMLLAGASAVQVVSAVYKKGIPSITHMLEEIKTWMERKKYSSLDDFLGKLSKNNLSDPFAYKRAQYVDSLLRSNVFMQYHPKRGEIDRPEQE
jgi:dihydroorotate dehydrogenase (fumarate)